MRVIGVVGLNGSGKDEVLKYLRARYGVPFVATGDIVREIAAQQGIEPTRSNLGEISDRYFRKYGKGYFIKVAVDRIVKNGWKAAGISGIRSPEDVSILRNILGKDFTLLGVSVSDPRVRYDRMLKRGEGRDRNTHEEFRRQDEAEEALFHVSEAMRQADRGIDNDGTLEDFHRQIDQLALDMRLAESDST